MDFFVCREGQLRRAVSNFVPFYTENFAKQSISKQLSFFQAKPDVSFTVVPVGHLFGVRLPLKWVPHRRC